MTCCERWGFDQRFGSADCFSISASCGRTFSASKILPKFVGFFIQFFVFQHQFLIHEDGSTFVGSFENVKRAISAPIEIIAQAQANQSPWRV
jgi:hypothetical protein